MAPLTVKFVGERGIDNGGLTAEFSRLIMSAIDDDTTVLQGPQGQKIITNNELSMYNYVCSSFTGNRMSLYIYIS